MNKILEHEVWWLARLNEAERDRPPTVEERAAESEGRRGTGYN